MHRRSLSLRSLIVALLALQLVLTMGLSGWLVLRGGEQTVDELVGHFQHDVSRVVNVQLRNWLSEPFIALALVARAIDREQLDTGEPRNLQALLRDYLEVHPDFTGFGFGDQSHGYVIAVTADRRTAETRYFMEYADTLTGGDFISYRIDEQGQVLDTVLQVPDLDIRERPWYRTARDLGRPVWSPVYLSISRASHGSLALTAAYPLHGADGELRGILTAILNLDQISEVLSEMDVGAGGRIYVVESSGLLVGSSNGADPIHQVGDEARRLPAVDSQDPLIRASARSIATHPGGFTDTTMAPETLTLDGERFRLLMRPLTLDTGLQWHTVVVIPEAVFLGGVRELFRWNLLVYLGVLGLALLVGLYLAGRISRPILRLARAARSMAAGNRSQRLPGSPIRELDAMARSFNDMAAQVQELVENLEWRVAERTRDLSDARDAADAANRSKSVFLANMSHELRTPLTAILGYGQLLPRQGALSERQRDSVRVINRSGEHLLGLIDEVLDMSRIEAGRLECVASTVDLHRLLEDLRAMLEGRAGIRDLRLTVDYGADLPRWVNVDGQRLRQVLINLLANAIKFTDHGEIWLRVRIRRWQGERGELWFTVADTGPGIAAADRPLLFRPFTQTPEGRRTGQGTGLGLALSQRLIQLMDGEIRLRSRPGRGSVFLVRLPASSTPAPVPSLREHGRVVGIQSGVAIPEVMVVDDDPVNRRMLAELLAAVGLPVLEAADGATALMLYRQHRPPAILLDLRLPDIDGAEVLQRLQEFAGPAPVVIMLTAHATPNERDRLCRLGARDLVTKPFRESVLFQVLGEHLGLVWQREGEAGEAPAPPLDAELLAARPTDWIDALGRAAEALDGAAIQRLLAALPAGQFREALATRLRQFDFDEIVEAVARVGEHG